ncbi:hypothetical protein [Actinomadura litoris]|uniref:hypothetical protein n=1 Tax=Actinomadura litoris TaxID=2678616 RepID=UPI001FA7F5B1|nr:hypothetical protein [Actinomadura litoris]
MERLTPAERVALVLHDVFDFPFTHIAEVPAVTPAAGRKLASRARARVAAVRERPRASWAGTERVLKAFKAAAARRPVRGAGPTDLLAIRQIEIRRPDALEIIEVNGRPALATYRGGKLIRLDTVEITDGRITELRRLVNPEKLERVGHI